VAKKFVVLSVIYENYDIFLRNYDAIIRQNIKSDIIFVIVDNTSSPNQSYVNDLILKDNVIYFYNVSKARYSFKNNSFHHAIALDLGINIIINRKINPETLIILDPDYFIFGTNWVHSFHNIMKRKRILFLGSPWGMKWANKYKNFPCVQCLLVDGNLISNLPSFTPVDTSKYYIMLFWRIVYSNRYLSYFVSKLLNHVFDTGSLIYNRYQNTPNVIFREISYDDLIKKNFYSNFSEFEVIMSMIKNLSNQIEIFEFDVIKCVHFRSFGNLNSNNEKSI